MVRVRWRRGALSWLSRRVHRCAAAMLVVAACSGSSSVEPSASGGVASPRDDGEDRAPEPQPIQERESAEPDEAPARSVAGFERFLYTYREAPCPAVANGDCDASAELLGDGRLRMDPWGEPGTSRLEARVSNAALAEAVAALRDMDLLSLLGQPSVCPDANRTEEMLVRLSGTDHHNLTGHCNESAVQSARAAIQRLTEEQFPNHSLITPPF